MTEEKQLYALPHDPMVEAIRIPARRGRELREAEHNVIYEGMTPEERRIAVCEKSERGELKPGEMTRLGRGFWLEEI